MKVDKFVDATGIACPLPIVRTKKAMDELTSGQILEVHATDKGAKADMTAWAKSASHEVLEAKEEDGIFKFLFKKG